jgi:hypothetical protein
MRPGHHSFAIHLQLTIPLPQCDGARSWDYSWDFGSNGPDWTGSQEAEVPSAAGQREHYAQER